MSRYFETDEGHSKMDNEQWNIIGECFFAATTAILIILLIDARDTIKKLRRHLHSLLALPKTECKNPKTKAKKRGY